MTRQVVPSREVPHLWIHEAQHHARNATRSLYFYDSTIYSYGSHFPIARIVANRHGARKVPFTTGSYSNTTAKHISHVRRAMPDWMPVIAVDYVADDSRAGDNLRAIVDDVADLLEKAFRARSNRPYYLAQADTRAQAARSFAEFYELAAPEFPELTAEGGKAIAAARAALKAEEERQRKAAQERHMADLAESLERWKAGNYWRTGLSSLEFAYLRLTESGEEVETTHGARFPVEHARAVWPILARLYASGGTYKRNGHSIHLGHYVLDEVRADGVIVAGCHRIERTEVERFARVLGLSSDLAQNAA